MGIVPARYIKGVRMDETVPTSSQSAQLRYSSPAPPASTTISSSAADHYAPTPRSHQLRTTPLPPETIDLSDTNTHITYPFAANPPLRRHSSLHRLSHPPLPSPSPSPSLHSDLLIPISSTHLAPRLRTNAEPSAARTTPGDPISKSNYPRIPRTVPRSSPTPNLHLSTSPPFHLSTSPLHLSASPKLPRRGTGCRPGSGAGAGHHGEVRHFDNSQTTAFSSSLREYAGCGGSKTSPQSSFHIRQPSLDSDGSRYVQSRPRPSSSLSLVHSSLHLSKASAPLPAASA